MEVTVVVFKGFPHHVGVDKLKAFTSWDIAEGHVIGLGYKRDELWDTPEVEDRSRWSKGSETADLYTVQVKGA